LSRVGENGAIEDLKTVLKSCLGPRIWLSTLIHHHYLLFSIHHSSRLSLYLFAPLPLNTKASTASILTALLGATQVHAQCVEGAREEISPGYIVQYKCDVLRVGTTHRNINSAIECAALARDAGATASTYHPPTKRCVVASENGAERPYPGTTCMVKVEEDPTLVEDEDDPFALDCEEQKAACLEREAALKEQLAASQAESSTGKADSARLQDILASNCE
jgi:hypothetical protein